MVTQKYREGHGFQHVIADGHRTCGNQVRHHGPGQLVSYDFPKWKRSCR